MPNTPRILALWSAPRSRSTAFYRMMAERGDFTCVHEPFSYLADFGAATIGETTVHTESDAVAALRELAERGPVFFKDTTDARYPAVLSDEAFLSVDVTHTFIIRDPRYTIPSYYALNPHVQREQIGMGLLWEIYSAVQRRTDATPVVLDGDELITAPEFVVRGYCEQVGIDFRQDALSWQPADRSEWSPTARWHAAASASSGFSAPQNDYATDVDSDPVLRDYLAYHSEFYRRLAQRRIMPPISAEPDGPPVR